MKHGAFAMGIILLLSISIIASCEPERPASRPVSTVKYTSPQKSTNRVNYPQKTPPVQQQRSPPATPIPQQQYAVEKTTVTRTATSSPSIQSYQTPSLQTRPPVVKTTTTPSAKKPYEEGYMGQTDVIPEETPSEPQSTTSSQQTQTSQQQSSSLQTNTAQQATFTPTVPAVTVPVPSGRMGYNSYAYLLQNANLAALLAHPRDIYIVDIDDAHLTSGEISELHSKGSTVVSYLSVGEAENYRNYWQAGWTAGNPSWLDVENPDWAGNFKVKFWDLEWQSIILANLDKIVDAGYDGVYLDIIDGYEYYQEKGVADADQKMIDWVKKISSRAKSKNPNFLIIPQNSPELAVRMGYLAVVDGLGKESTWYEAENKIPEDRTSEAALFLDGAVANGKFVLAIDYPVNTAKRCDFIAKARAHGFVPTVGPIALDRIEEMPTC